MQVNINKQTQQLIVKENDIIHTFNLSKVMELSSLLADNSRSSTILKLIAIFYSNHDIVDNQDIHVESSLFKHISIKEKFKENNDVKSNN